MVLKVKVGEIEYQVADIGYYQKTVFGRLLSQKAEIIFKTMTDDEFTKVHDKSYKDAWILSRLSKRVTPTVEDDNLLVIIEIIDRVLLKLEEDQKAAQNFSQPSQNLT